jgi:hypothetical protein
MAIHSPFNGWYEITTSTLVNLSFEICVKFQVSSFKLCFTWFVLCRE